MCDSIVEFVYILSFSWRCGLCQLLHYLFTCFDTKSRVFLFSVSVERLREGLYVHKFNEAFKGLWARHRILLLVVVASSIRN